MHESLRLHTEKLIRLKSCDTLEDCKSLAARAVREATVHFEPLCVLRKVFSHAEFKKLGPKCCSQAVLCCSQAVFKNSIGDVHDAPATHVPDAIVEKVWNWIKTTRELKKSSSIGAACNAVAFICCAKGHGMLWGDEAEAELESILKEGIESVQHDDDARRHAASSPQDTWSKHCLKASESVIRARIELEKAAELNDISLQSLENMLSVQLAYPYKLRKESDPVRVQVTKHAYKPALVITVVTSAVATAFAHSLYAGRKTTSAAGAGTEGLVEALQSRLEAAVESLRLRLSFERKTRFAVSEALLAQTDESARAVHNRRVIGTFIGKGGTNIAKLQAKLDSVAGPTLVTLADDGCITVSIDNIAGTVDTKAKETLRRLLKEEISATKAKVHHGGGHFHRSRRYRPAVRPPHLISLKDPFDYAWGKKTARMQRYNCARKSRTVPKVDKTSTKIGRIHTFCGVVQDLDLDRQSHKNFDASCRKVRPWFVMTNNTAPNDIFETLSLLSIPQARNAVRCATKRQERRIREARINAQRSSKSRKGASKSRSRARASKLELSALAEEDFRWVQGGC
mmetsp:Transcript_19828/g.35884  ORF Transcript_19828/g.35884 Transcript_19828/m.35884 type:complete len:570 (-) Transcript_19828:131-1840(-)